MDNDKAILELSRQFNELKLARQSWEPTWTEILDHCAPDLKGYINAEKANAGDKGNRQDDQVYDGTPVEYCLRCAAGLYAAISSPSRPWFKLTMNDEALNDDPDVRVWLDDVAELIYDVMHSSNFYQAMYSVYLHQTTIGTSCLLMLPDYENVIRVIPFNIGQYWMSCDSSDKVDTIYREFVMTRRNLIKTFGKDNLPTDIVQSVNDNRLLEVEHTIIHCIKPNTDKLGDLPQEYLSAYYLRDSHEGKFLQLSGYEKFPAIATRWYVNHGEVYGKLSPGRTALGDCKQYQTMIWDYNEGLQRAINPPVQGASGALEQGALVTIPGAFNPIVPQGAGSDQSLKPVYQINPDLGSMWASIQDKREQLSQRFFVDLFMAISLRTEKDMTAQEVRELSGEKMMALGAGLENLNNELLNPAIDLIFHYCNEAGIVPQAPDSIAGTSFKPEYVSILAQAQKLVDVNRISQLIQMGLGMAQADPTIMDKLDLDSALEHADKMIGAPAGIIRSDKDVAKIRGARQQKQQMAESLAMAQQGAETAQTMSQTPVGQGQQSPEQGGDNALDRVLSGLGMPTQ